MLFLIYFIGFLHCLCGYWCWKEVWRFGREDVTWAGAAILFFLAWVLTPMAIIIVSIGYVVEVYDNRKEE